MPLAGVDGLRVQMKELTYKTSEKSTGVTNMALHTKIRFVMANILYIKTSSDTVTQCIAQHLQ